MEPDMASAMLYRMKEDGCEVLTIHADNDSTTAARLRNDCPSLQKKQDKNHLKKNLTKQLYKLAKDHKQLKPTDIKIEDVCLSHVWRPQSLCRGRLVYISEKSKGIQVLFKFHIIRTDNKLVYLMLKE